MSSFVIAKEDYIKCAGIIAGIAERKNIWFYNYENRRNSTKEDYYNLFVRCFEMNALSVMEQYGDSTPETDTETYKQTFNKYYADGKQLCFKENDLKKNIMEIRNFCRSALYQTEKDSYNNIMRSWFNEILVQLMPFLYTYECNNWGSWEDVQ